jgi:hypothetical protein
MDELNLASERVQELIARLSNVNFYCAVIAGSVITLNEKTVSDKHIRKNDPSVKKTTDGRNPA